MVNPPAAADGGERRIPRRSIAFWGVLVLFLPVALFGIALSPNEYRAWGGSGVDCDGPLGVWMFALPPALVYSLAALVLARGAVRRRAWSPALVALCCAALAVPLALNLRDAVRETRAPDHRLACGQ